MPTTSIERVRIVVIAKIKGFVFQVPLLAGPGKRRFSLDRIMAKLAETLEVVIMVSFIVMNLEKILSSILLFVLNVCLPVWTALRWVAWRTYNRMQWEQRLCPGDAKIC